MAVIIIKNDVDGNHGPWTDDWQIEYEYDVVEAIARAVKSEGGE